MIENKTPPRLLRRPEVLRLVGVSASTLRRIADFPRALQINPGSVAWRADEVGAWIDKRTAQRDAEEAA